VCFHLLPFIFVDCRYERLSLSLTVIAGDVCVKLRFNRYFSILKASSRTPRFNRITSRLLSWQPTPSTSSWH